MQEMLSFSYSYFKVLEASHESLHEMVLECALVRFFLSRLCYNQFTYSSMKSFQEQFTGMQLNLSLLGINY